MNVHIWTFDKDIKIEGKNFYMPSSKLKIGSTAHVDVIKKTTTNNIFNNNIIIIYNNRANNNQRIGRNTQTKNIYKIYKMINFDDYSNENIIEHNSKWPYIPDHPYRILIIGGSGSGKTNALLNFINNQPDIDKIYLYAKDPYEQKYQYLINKREKVGLNHLNDPKAFMEYSNDMQDVYKNIEDYNPIKKRKVLIIFDDMIADMINNNKLNPIVTELFIRGRKLNISIVFITQSYFKVSKDVRLNSTHFFIMKIPNKRELQQIALNHSSEIDFKDFMNIYKKPTKEPYSFLVNDTTLPSDDPLRFRKNILG